MENKDIIWIAVGYIHQHPDNPRKDLGDLSELAESIKKKGVMQNLTVIPGHWDGKGAWHREGYTLIIGHRRCAAAKLAGLKELPCKVVEGMGRKEQVAVMLEENMQRNDLTIWEQANGFQMMLDLGATEAQIAERTGFSKSTIRRRLNIAKLDQGILREKERDECFQLSLNHLYALERIEDIAERDKILKEAKDSQDLAWRVESKVNEEIREKRARVIVGMLEAEGVKKAPATAANEMYSGKWAVVNEYSLEKDAPGRLGLPKEDKGALFYLCQYRTMKVIRKAKKKKETAEDKERKERDARKKQIKAIMKEMDARKRELIEGVVSGKIAPIKETEEVKEEIWHALIRIGSYISMNTIRRFISGKEYYEYSEGERKEADGKARGLSVLHQMLIVLGNGLENIGDLYDYQGHCHTGNCETFRREYAILERYGWTFTEEEARLLDGTHELYTPEKKEG